jgi:hypothetical protein
MILTQQTESQLVRNGFANAASACEQKLLDTHSVDHRSRMGIAPRRIPAAGFKTSHIDCVFDSEAQSIEWATTAGRQIESCYKGVTLGNADRGALHRS